MLKSTKSNHSTKRKAKNIMSKTKKNNFRKSQNTKNMKMTKATNLQQNNKSSHLKNICVSPTFHQLDLQYERPKEVRPNNTFDQKHTEVTLVQNKNSILDMVDSSMLFSAHNDCFYTRECLKKRNPDDLFNLIYTGRVIIDLPNRSWSIHCAEKPVHCIVVSEVNLNHDRGLGFIPIYMKQIVFYEKMNYDIFLLNSKASEKNLSASIESIADVMNIVKYTNNLKLCIGGPEVSLYNNVNLECAYKDNKEKWRHNLCNLEVSESDTCELCLSLEDILKRHIQRNKQSSRTKGFNGSGKRKRTSQ